MNKIESLEGLKLIKLKEVKILTVMLPPMSDLTSAMAAPNLSVNGTKLH
jgi:hypothetical protein